ncbi:MAG: serine/threonine-protein kinase, partial [Gaiellales bacterium]
MQDAVAREPSRQQTPICGRYELLEPIGSGGSGQVWLARDELASREVALKIVHGAGRAAERAEREAAAVARLDDPRCAELYSIERDERNVYLVYEYIEGKTLREALGEYSLTDADVVEVSAQILEALDHAHAHGIVHRDIKPTNVLLEESDAGEIRVRVLDFGLALIDDVDSLTAAGDVPGTLAYISPERLAGEQACGGADVWSVGLILWEGLGGRHPFFSNSPVETAELIAAGAPSLAAERPDLGARLVAAIEQALSVDPEDRPAPLVLAQRLRSALVPGARRRTRRARVSRGLVAERGVHAGLAAAFVATALSLFPFFPPSFTVPLATGLALLAFAAPRLGLAATLAVPVLPLGDVSGGLAVAYGAFAIGWFIVMRRSPTSALLPVGGPILAAFGALAAAPLLALRTPGVARRALVGGIAVLAAIAMEGLRTHILPPTGEAAPLGLGIEGSVSPTAVVSALAAFL